MSNPYSSSKPHGIFGDYVKKLKSDHKKNKEFFKGLMKKSNKEIKEDTTKEEFEKWFKESEKF